MNRRRFIKATVFSSLIPQFLKAKTTSPMQQNHMQLLRHATLVIRMGNQKLIIDPMLSAKEEMDPVANCGNDFRIPMVDLPIKSDELKDLINNADAILVTHTHRDHWDAAAQQLIPKDKQIFCQPADLEKITLQGFTNVKAINNSLQWKSITLNRTGGQHGTGEIGKAMGIVSGFVIMYENKSVYIAGDTIYCKEVEDALTTYQPHYTIVNAGGAKFLTGDPITMSPDDIRKVKNKLPSTSIIAVHMDTVNHCFIKRKDLHHELNKTRDMVIIPQDGEVIHFL